LSITLNGPQTIDWISCVAWDRVWVFSQTTTSEDGIYIVQTGAWTRTYDAEVDDDLSWADFYVQEGTVAQTVFWVINTEWDGVVGTNNLTLRAMSGAGALWAESGTHVDSGTGFVRLGGPLLEDAIIGSSSDWFSFWISVWDGSNSVAMSMIDSNGWFYTSTENSSRETWVRQTPSSGIQIGLTEYSDYTTAQFTIEENGSHMTVSGWKYNFDGIRNAWDYETNHWLVLQLLMVLHLIIILGLVVLIKLIPQKIEYIYIIIQVLGQEQMIGLCENTLETEHF